MELMRLWRVVSRRRMWVYVPFLLVSIAAMVAAALTRPDYEATARVLLVPHVKPASVLGPGLPEAGGLNTFSKTGTPLDTQAELAQRGAILERVIREIGLTDPESGAPLTPGQFLEIGHVAIVKGTDLLAFTYRHRDPDVARRTADGWARAYEEDNRLLSRQQLQRQADFLAGQLGASRQAQSRADDALRDFRIAKGALAPTEDARAITQTLGLLEVDLRQTAASCAESTARLKTLRRQVGLSASRALSASAYSQAPGLQRLREQLQAAETELALARGRLTEDNPEVRLRQAQVEAVRGRMLTETTRAVGRAVSVDDPAVNMDPVRQSLTHDLIQAEVAAAGAQSRKVALDGLTRTFAARLQTLPAKEHHLAQLERNATLASERHSLLQRNLAETKLKLAMNVGSATVIDSAEMPVEPITPGRESLVSAGAALGLALGLSLALGREYLNGGVKTLAEAAAVVPVPMLQLLPWHRAAGGITMVSAPEAPASEAYRLLRARLLGPEPEPAARLIAFTSAGDGEGTSTTVANMAVAFAQLGRRVLVIDADMAAPGLHRLLDLANDRGVTSVLSGQAPLARAVQRGPVAALDVLTSGPDLGQAADGLASAAMRALLDEARRLYDIVLVDVPPALAASGAASLARLVDGFVVVMGLDRVTPDAARRTIDCLQASGGQVLGAVACALHPHGPWQEAQVPGAGARRGRPPVGARKETPMVRFATRWFVTSLMLVGLTGHTLPAEAAVAPAPIEAVRPGSGPVADSGYVLRYGDTLSVWMLGSETFKLENQPIRPDGRVTIPLLGEVRAAGLTVAELSATLTRDYRRFVLDPRLVVNVASFRPLKINMLGLVNRPGTYTVSEPTNLLEGLALAGGTDRQRADTRAIEVRRADGHRQVVSLERVLSGQAEPPMLGDGDTVIVAEVSGPDWERILPHMATTLSIIGSIAVIAWNLRN